MLAIVGSGDVCPPLSFSIFRRLVTIHYSPVAGGLTIHLVICVFESFGAW